MFEREIKNLSGAPITIKDMGLILEVGETRLIEYHEYARWAESSDLDPALDSNSAAICHSGVQLSAHDGKALIHDITDYVDLLEDGTLKDRKTSIIDFTGGLLKVTDRDDGKAEVTIRPFILSRCGGIGLTRKGGFIVRRK